ncbi:thioredoxin-dependent thiol peroxidase [Chitinophagales bacterium]|nr:thioredoxin-dependent thiol peroxidase [Chitinophagales bacterium]|tara:strand:+ start:6853 stop:7314 length:462 start_codon:yes stop_codon:yes gene_type:complete
MKLVKGDQAPSFESIDQNGSSIRLNQFKGKKIILYFYPKDDTPGCTANACDFRDNYAELQDLGYAVIGVSSQDEKSHTKFINKYNLPFPLIADTDLSVHHAYGVWGPKKFMGREYEGTHRTTFIIDEQNVIVEIISKVKTKTATQQIKDLLEG